MSTEKLRQAGIAPMPTVENALGRYLQEIALENLEQHS
jgi:hypothetical protein